MTNLTSEQNLLTRMECNVMRGFAIMAVASNNFGHMISGVIQDNEFAFDYSQVDGFVSSLKNPGSTFWLDLLSFYSPFGVMLFIFLSGYGLTLKYEKNNSNEVSHKDFIADHYRKLFLMQLKGLALFLTISFVYNPELIVYFKPLIRQILMVENLNPIEPVILAGPYWFFGMIMEVYIIYRLLLYKRSSLLLAFIVFISIVLQTFVEPNGGWIHYLRMNLCMAIFPFGLGIVVARYSDRIISKFNTILKCLCFLLLFGILLTICKFNFYTWLIMPLFIIGVSVPMAKILCRFNLTAKIFSWLGGLSGVVFVVHPFLREILIDRTNSSDNPYGMFLVYLFLTIVLAMILKPVFVNNKLSKQ